MFNVTSINRNVVTSKREVVRLNQSIGSSVELSHSSIGTFSTPDPENFKLSGSLSSKSSVADSTLSSSTGNECRVKLLGCLKNLFDPAEGSLDLINIIDIAQCEERLPFVCEDEHVLFSLNKYGILITDLQLRVLQRIPLYRVERIVTYDDGVFGDVMLAVKTVASRAGAGHDVHVYRCENAETGQKICRRFSHALDAVLSTAAVRDQ